MASPSPSPSASICRSSQVRTILRPLDPQHPSRGDFAWRFHINRDQFDPRRPTILFFPGGPGQTGMTQALSYPDEFQIIRFDPRGLGCNSRNDFSSFSSAVQAQDVVAMVESLGLQNYIFHGISYGTMVATQAAHLLEIKIPSRVAKPRGLVLEGTLGRAFRADEYWASYAHNWSLMSNRLPRDVRTLLETHSEPLGIPSTMWGNFISTHLLFGMDRFAIEDFSAKLSNLLGSPEDKSDLKKWVRRFSAPASRDSRRQHQQIVCREIAPDMREQQFDFVLRQGHLVPIESQTYCSPWRDRGLAPYDSARFPLHTPTVVFHGEFDPATPRFQTDHFYGRSLRGPKHLIHVQSGGHAALSGSLAQCGNLFWSLWLDKTPSTETLSMFTESCRQDLEAGASTPLLESSFDEESGIL